MTLHFEKVSIKDKDMIDSYSLKYGENSCQHSFASMYCHEDKYGDSVCKENGWLYICREKLGNDERKVYLCPMGNQSDEGGFAKAIRNVLIDASKENKKVVFYTITENTKRKIEMLFPGMFNFYEDRACYEYLYSRQKLIDLTGSGMATRRRQCRLFYKNNKDVKIEIIDKKMIDEIADFQNLWMAERMSKGLSHGLIEEDKAIKNGLSSYEKLGLFGMTMKVNGKMAGYVFGSPLSDNCFDIMAEKGARSIPYVYMAIKQALPKICDEKYSFINWEEDVGDSGLRTMKLRYHPDVLMKKYKAEQTDL